MSIIVSPIPDHYRALVDDAAIFPPGNAALPQAVSAHREHLNASYAALVDAPGADEVDLRCIELALRDENDLAHNARRFITAVGQVLTDGHLDEDVTVFVETPRLFDRPPTRSWLVALDEVAAMDMRLKFRTGFEHHGFLNVLLATRATIDGATTEEVVAILDGTGSNSLASCRRWFTSFGSCSVLEPLEDLLELDLLPDLKLESA